METKTCKACKDPRAKFVEEQIWLGKLTVMDGAKMFGMSYEDYWDHLKHHRKQEEKLDFNDLGSVLRYLAKSLKQRVDLLMTTPVNPTIERGVSTQARLLKDIVMDIAKLEHQIETAPQIQIQTFISQHTELVSFLLSELCSDCKQKVMKYLESSKGESS